MRRLIPLIAAVAGGAAWYPAKVWAHQAFGEKALFGHLLESPVNMFTCALFCYVIAMLAMRCPRLLREYRWRSFDDVLPRGEHFESFYDVEPFLKRLVANSCSLEIRPLRLLRVCYESVRGNWSATVAANALDTQFQLMRAEAEASYAPASNLCMAIPPLGFIGTVLGISQSMGVINDDLDSAIAEMHVAFDTTLVALILGVVAGSIALSLVQKVDDWILNTAFQTVHNDFISRIREE